MPWARRTSTPHWLCTTPTPRWKARWCHLLGTEDGVVRGRSELRRFVERVFAHQPPQRRRHRTGFCSDGTKLMWEYPRQAPDGDQMDIVEVMDIHDGLIQRHRVYWGWYSVGMISTGEHPN